MYNSVFETVLSALSFHSAPHKNVSKPQAAFLHDKCPENLSMCTGLENRGHWFNPCLANFFLKIDDSHCNRIHSPLTANHCLNDITWGSSQYLGENILQSTGKRNSRRA